MSFFVMHSRPFTGLRRFALFLWYFLLFVQCEFFSTYTDRHYPHTGLKKKRSRSKGLSFKKEEGGRKNDHPPDSILRSFTSYPTFFILQPAFSLISFSHLAYLFHLRSV
ncbi:MAG: hypothetical protein J3R72DRAFT_430456 [Linnemannia gamsii]|nr:MAG: hypothetical protein J3R72DRAFT_430456 [Linnemannia gamsii]